MANLLMRILNGQIITDNKKMIQRAKAKPKPKPPKKKLPANTQPKDKNMPIKPKPKAAPGKKATLRINQGGYKRRISKTAGLKAASAIKKRRKEPESIR
jgi:hypothetical protein